MTSRRVRVGGTSGVPSTVEGDEEFRGIYFDEVGGRRF